MKTLSSSAEVRVPEHLQIGRPLAGFRLADVIALENARSSHIHTRA
jgi:hypothetical protein